MQLPKQPLILFDGVCNLCNSSVQRVIRNDPKGSFRYAPLQSAFGQQVVQYFGLELAGEGSMVFVDQGKAYTRSTAALRIAKGMAWPWKLLWMFMLVPRPVRDAVYRWVARNRYKWFGKRESCMVPTPELKERFLA